MNRFLYFFLPILLLPATRTFAQDTLTSQATTNDTGQIIYEDESVRMSYRDEGPFRPLDSLKNQGSIYSLTSPFAQQQFFGAGMDIQSWYTNSLAVGISISIAGRGIRQAFGYTDAEPVMTYYEGSLFQELKLLRRRRLEIAARLYTGFAAFHLADNSIQVQSSGVDPVSGASYESEEALPVANNYFLRIAPAAVLRYNLSRKLMIESSIAYNCFIGHVKFGNRSDFNNYQLQLGLKIDLSVFAGLYDSP